MRNLRLVYCSVVCFFLLVACKKRIILEPVPIVEMIDEYILPDSTYDILSLNREYKDIGEFKFIKNKLGEEELFLLLSTGDVIYYKNEIELYYVIKENPYVIYE